MFRRALRVDWLWLGQAALLLIVIVVVTRSYIGEERWIHYWDHAVYQDIAWKTSEAFRVSFRSGWQALQTSFNEDYNALFALPLIPFVRALGDSRLSFETALAIVSLFPLPLAVGSLAVRLMPGPRRRIYWLAAWLTLLTPMSWVPTLRGYPDALPAALVVWAICAHLDGGQDRWLRGSLLAGLLLGSAVLLRRHFGYAAVAFLVSAALEPFLLRACRVAESRLDRARMAVSSARVLATALTAFALIVIVGAGFVRRIWSHDFLTLYSGYVESIGTVLRWYLLPYGLLGWLGAIAGYAVAIPLGMVKKPAALFAALFGVVSIAQWLFGVRQLGEQCTLHFTASLILGLCMLSWTVWVRSRGLLRTILVELVVVYLVVNAHCGLALLNPAKDSPIRPLFAGRWSPPQRDDYRELMYMTHLLRLDGTSTQRVYVAASSHVFNPDIVRHAEWTFHGRRDARFDVLPVPEVDSRDPYPLGALLDAQTVLVADPFQHHLRAEEQQVVKVVHDLFMERCGLAQDFGHLSNLICLEQEVRVHVFRRQRPTDLATALETLALLRAALPSRPGTQPDWAVVDRLFPSWLTLNADGSARWVAHPGRRGQEPSTAMAYLGAGDGPLALEGRLSFIDRRCLGVTVALSTLDRDGVVRDLESVQRRPGGEPTFKVELKGRAPAPLLLRLLEVEPGASIDFCLLTIDGLRVAPQ